MGDVHSGFCSVGTTRLKIRGNWGVTRLNALSTLGSYGVRGRVPVESPMMMRILVHEEYFLKKARAFKPSSSSASRQTSQWSTSDSIPWDSNVTLDKIGEHDDRLSLDCRGNEEQDRAPCSVLLYAAGWLVYATFLSPTLHPVNFLALHSLAPCLRRSNGILFPVQYLLTEVSRSTRWVECLPRTWIPSELFEAFRGLSDAKKLHHQLQASLGGEKIFQVRPTCGLPLCSQYLASSYGVLHAVGTHWTAALCYLLIATFAATIKGTCTISSLSPPRSVLTRCTANLVTILRTPRFSWRL
ncbi:uncharacterized protein CIMG_12992 [Coccidioides immitis RS]|uniref:Uncharacterized protein n=1 Tax=Coccidioides immitis (strain RS) TaxID=246410 RepID=A0A0D8JTK5_COCIM|nr:uncharacterized protein CIMG_12992 [Coccidioides immitis RS]KJF60474.1 hypothetical protein CIMG_12992 [Coccidioides immitis RS]